MQRLAREKRIDGVVLIGSTASDEELASFAQEDVPCVLVARRCASLHSVYVNNRTGARDATEFLVRKGHRAIACNTCQAPHLPMDERVAGYRDALKSHKGACRESLLIEAPGDDMNAGLAVFSRLNESGHAPVTAVFVPAGDSVAIGIIKAAKKAGIRVPEDLAVVGYDDLPVAEVIEPALTTVRQPKLEMGDYAINLIVDCIEGKESSVKHKELRTKFIVRESA